MRSCTRNSIHVSFRSETSDMSIAHSCVLDPFSRTLRRSFVYRCDVLESHLIIKQIKRKGKKKKPLQKKRTKQIEKGIKKKRETVNHHP